MEGLVVLIVVAVGGLGALGTILVRTMVVPRRAEKLNELVDQGKTRLSIRGAKQILAREPRNVDAHFVLGRAYAADGQEELALAELRTVNEIGQFTAVCREDDFRRLAAGLYARFGHLDEALKEYALLIKTNPNEADSYYQVGELFERRNEAKRAVGYFAKTVQLDAKHAKARLKLGQAYYRAGKAAEAKRELEAALALEPGNARASFFLGRMAREAGENQAAIRYLAQAQKDSEYKARALLESGSAYAAAGDTERAVSELQRAVRNSSGDASPEALYARYLLGALYEKSRDLDHALQEWEIIHAHKPAFRDVAQKLSEYQDLRADDHLKDFLTASADEFEQQCVGIAKALGLEIDDSRDIPGGREYQVREVASGVRNQRRMGRVLQLLRTTEPVEEPAVRRVHEHMRAKSISRGMIVSSAGFAPAATRFADTRSIDLLGREELSKLLKRTAAG